MIAVQSLEISTLRNLATVMFPQVRFAVAAFTNLSFLCRCTYNSKDELAGRQITTQVNKILVVF